MSTFTTSYICLFTIILISKGFPFIEPNNIKQAKTVSCPKSKPYKCGSSYNDAKSNYDDNGCCVTKFDCNYGEYCYNVKKDTNNDYQSSSSDDSDSSSGSRKYTNNDYQSSSSDDSDSSSGSRRYTKYPTKRRTKRPTNKPTKRPTKKPTYRPTKKPTYRPTKKPTYRPTKKPTYRPTKKPTYRPTKKSTYRPTKKPTYRPTRPPTLLRTNVHTTTINEICNTRCGIDWTNANNKCGECCSNNDDCSIHGESCFANLTLTPCINTKSPTNKDTCITRCGINWDDANTKCGNCCSNNDDCHNGELCFANLSINPCILNTETTLAPTIKSECNNTRCGINWNDANTKCGNCCKDNSDCNNNEMCFADLSNTPCIQTATISPTIKTECNTRCGIDWNDANNKCGNCCNYNDDCNASELCFANLTINSCIINTETTLAPTIKSECNTRCGNGWNDANIKCGDCCKDNSDCSNGETCFADVSKDPCIINTKTTLSPTTKSQCSIRCGINWNDANTKCGECCTNNDDCSINGELCYNNLSKLPCGNDNLGTNNIKTIMSCGTGKYISLTFDDGPILLNDATDIIINKLNEYNIKATFYLSPLAYGNNPININKKCKLVKKLIKNGHDVQSHSWDHPNFLNLTNYEIIEQLKYMYNWIYKCSGYKSKPNIFRPPYGYLSKEQAILINKLGYIISLWNLDSNDWKTPNDFNAIKNNINVNSFNDNSIVLLVHDKSIYQIIDEIINLFNNGYEFITQKECYNKCDTLDSYGICRDPNGYIHYTLNTWFN